MSIRRAYLWAVLCLAVFLSALSAGPQQTWGQSPQQQPTLPPAVWMTPIGGETLPGTAGPDYMLLGGIACLLALGVAAVVVAAILLLRRQKGGSAPPRTGPTVPPGHALIVRSGPGQGARYPISQAAVTLGRAADCQVVINHPAIAPHHARITWDGQRFAAHDLGSPSGTSVNGYRLTGPVVFRPGDVLSLGGAVELVFQANP